MPALPAMVAAAALIPTATLANDDYGPQLAVLSWILVVASAVFLGLRIFLKTSHRRGLWWDDYLLIASWLALTAGVVLNTMDVGYGYGRHTFAVTPAHLAHIVTDGTVSGTIILLAAAWSKTSFAFTLLRLPIGWMRYLVWAIIVTLNLAMHLSALSIWVECPFAPPPGQQTIPAPDRVCIPIQVAVEFGIVVGGYSAAVDFTLALLPWKFLWNLQMQRREKLGVLIAMSMGVFAGLSAVIKTTKLTTLESPDIIDSVQLAAWGTAEVGVTIMAASIPILRALFRAGVPNLQDNGADTGATPEQRRGAAAAVAAAEAAGGSDIQTAFATAPPPPSYPDETKRWPLLTPKTARYPSTSGGVGGDLGDGKMSYSGGFKYSGGGGGGGDEYDDDDYDDLKKPVRSSSRSFFKSS